MGWGTGCDWVLEVFVLGVEIRVLRRGDAGVLERVAEGVFDGPVRRELVEEFLGDGRHHLVVAVEEGVVVGMATGVHYVHPDKAAELWVNEVGVSPQHWRRGIGRRLVARMLEVARELGCAEAWVLTEKGNGAARGLYAACGGREREVVMVEFRLEGGARGWGVGDEVD